MIAIQVVHTLWTKYSRGAPQSVIRNSLPESIPLTGLTDIDGESMIVHDVVYDESRQFKKTEKRKIVPKKSFNVNEAEINITEQAVRVVMFKGEEISIGYGEFGRVVFNYRVDISNGDDWYTRGYNKVSINIYNGEDCTEVRFDRKTPDRELRRLVRP